MNSIYLKKISTVATMSAMALVAISVRVEAGDKIIVGDDKPKGDPNTQVKAGGDLFKSWNKIEQPSFNDGILGIPTLPRVGPMNRKEEQQLKMQRAEEKNWMFLDRGELQRKEENKEILGVRNSALDSFDKQEIRSDYTFYKVNEGKNASQGRQPGEARATGQTGSKEEQAADAQQQREREDEADKHDSHTFTLKDAQSSRSLTSGELNFKGLFDPGQRDALTFGGAGKSDVPFPKLLGNPSARTRESERLASSPLQNPSTFGLASPFSLSQPIGGSLPTFSKPLDAPAPKPANDIFSSAPSALPNRLAPPGLPTLPTLNNSPGAAPSVFQQQTPVPDSRSWFRPAQEPMRRKF